MELIGKEYKELTEDLKLAEWGWNEPDGLLTLTFRRDPASKQAYEKVRALQEVLSHFFCKFCKNYSLTELAVLSGPAASERIESGKLESEDPFPPPIHVLQHVFFASVREIKPVSVENKEEGNE